MKKRTFILGILIVGICANVFAANTVSVYKSNAVASYYADKFHGRKTSSGETFDMYALTAAHKTLPFGTMVKVTNLANGKSVVVRINDRGPFVAGREIDLSKAAAKQLDMIGTGTAHVSLQIVGGNESVAQSVPSTTKKEAVSSTSKAQRWDIQLGSFASRTNAEAFAKKAQRAGIKNLAYQSTNGVTRVIVRDLSTEEVAPQLQLLETKGFTDFLVKERKN